MRLIVIVCVWLLYCVFDCRNMCLIVIHVKLLYYVFDCYTACLIVICVRLLYDESDCYTIRLLYYVSDCYTVCLIAIICVRLLYYVSDCYTMCLIFFWTPQYAAYTKSALSESRKAEIAQCTGFGEMLARSLVRHEFVCICYMFWLVANAASGGLHPCITFAALATLVLPCSSLLLKWVRIWSDLNDHVDVAFFLETMYARSSKLGIMTASTDLDISMCALGPHWRTSCFFVDRERRRERERGVHVDCFCLGYTSR